LSDIAAREANTLIDLRDRAAASGIALEELSVGAIPTLRFSAVRGELMEIRPGNYVFYDRTQVALCAAGLDQCALTVLATVVSKPSADRLILDCGSKTLTTDQARGITPVPGYGAVLTNDGTACDDALRIERLSEEHAIVSVQGGAALEPGDRVRVLPNHSCVVSNLVDEIRLVDGGCVVDTIAVAARGKIA
jgi:D-serine deaminase-like pyridoxal phosphate-dependent protein